MSETSVANLPVNGRNFIDFALLTPGVTRDVRTGDISFAGQRGTLNSLVVDGADNNNTFFGQTLGRTGSGRAPYQFSQDAVQEFQVNSNAYSAEYGRAGGAVINVVTKSGTNQHPRHRCSSSTATRRSTPTTRSTSLNDRPKSPYHFNQFGGTIGGPIRRDRHFFFFNYDGQRNTQPNVVFSTWPGRRRRATPRHRPAIATAAAAGGRAGSGSAEPGRVPGQDRSVSSRGDHRLTLRYNHQNFNGEGFENGGTAAVARAHRRVEASTRGRSTARVASVFGSSAVQRAARAVGAATSEPGEANSEKPEADDPPGRHARCCASAATSSARARRPSSAWQVADTLTWVRGAHKVKGGFDFQFDDILNFFPGNFSGVYTFQTLAVVHGGRPTARASATSRPSPATGTTGPTHRPGHPGVLVLRAGRVARRGRDVTVNAGLRYDIQKFAQPPVRNPDPQLAAAGIDTSVLNTDSNNWGPRLGIAWAPVGRRYVVRAGYGLFYGRTPSIMVGTAHSNNGINVQTITFTGALVPTYPNSFASLPAGVTLPRPTIFTLRRRLPERAHAAGEHRRRVGGRCRTRRSP